MKRKELISKITEAINTEGIDAYELKDVLKAAKKAVNAIPILNKKDEKGNQIWKVCISEGSKCDTWYYTVKAKSENDAIKKAKKEILELKIPDYDRENIIGLKSKLCSLEAEKNKKEKKNPDARYPNGDKINYERLKAFAPKSFRKDEEDRNPGNVTYYEADDR